MWCSRARLTGPRRPRRFAGALSVPPSVRPAPPRTAPHRRPGRGVAESGCLAGTPGAETRGRHGLLQLRRAGEWPCPPPFLQPRRPPLPGSVTPARGPAAPLPAPRLCPSRPRVCPCRCPVAAQPLVPSTAALSGGRASPCAPRSTASLRLRTALLPPTTELRFPVAVHPLATPVAPFSCGCALACVPVCNHTLSWPGAPCFPSPLHTPPLTALLSHDCDSLAFLFRSLAVS